MKRILLALIVASAILLTGCDAILESFYPEFAEGGEFGNNSPRVLLDGPTIIRMNGGPGPQGYDVISPNGRTIHRFFWRVDHIDINTFVTTPIDINGQYDHEVTGGVAKFNANFSTGTSEPDIQASQWYQLTVEVEYEDGGFARQVAWLSSITEQTDTAAVANVTAQFFDLVEEPTWLDTGGYNPYTYVWRLRLGSANSAGWSVNADNAVTVGGTLAEGSFAGPGENWGGSYTDTYNAFTGSGTYSDSITGTLYVVRVEIDIDNDGTYDQPGDLVSSWRPIVVDNTPNNAFVDFDQYNFYYVTN